MLSENRRQVHGWERDALSQLRDQDIATALGRYESKGRIRESETFSDARSRLAADWFEERQLFSYKDVRMFAIRRSDVEELNHGARTHLRRAGLLGPTVYRTSYGADFAHNEEVICLRNDNRLGVVNGTRAKVVGVAPGGLRLSADGNELRLPHAYMESGHLAYGYASTIHKAQGATVDTAFVLGSGTLYREAAYVAMSRAREASYLYVAPDTLDLSMRNGNSFASESAHTPASSAPHLTLFETISRSQAKTLATDHLSRNSRTRPKNGNGNGDADSDYLTDTLGRRPTRGPAMAKWDRAAQAIEHYRATNGWSGRTALGPPPTDRVARMEHVSALDAILEYGREREQARIQERSRQRSNNVGLSL